MTASLVALVLYVVFRAWYDGWRHPLTPAEVERTMAALEVQGVGTPEEREVLRAFFAADDGREFLMLNLVRLADGPVRNPATGAMQSPRALLAQYTGPFVRALIRRGGHPAFLAAPVGGFVDTWGVSPAAPWTMVGMMRYRSRRDLAALVTDPRFADAHPFKRAAMPVTCSFPMGRIRFFTSPRLLVGLVLALGAALAHILLGGTS
jgi:hypothetical protein